MKGASAWILAVLAVLSSSAAQNCPFPDPLTHVVFLPDPSDCTVYYMCSHGKPIQQQCPSGLHFNTAIDVCDWPQSANCQAGQPPSGTSQPPSGTSQPPSGTSQPPSGTSQPPSGTSQPPIVTSQPSTVATQPPTGIPSNCVHGSLIPHRSNCSKFYICSNEQLFEKECLPNLHFNPILLVCDWAETANCVIGCEKLDDGPTGIWIPQSCSNDVNDIGATCGLQCGKDYVLKGSAYIHCTEDGWDSSNGNVIPKCVPKECIGEDLENELNKTLSVDASLLFVLDESGSVGTVNFQKTKDFVKDVITAFPLSATRSSGVVTFASDSLVPVSLRVSDTADFLRQVDAIRYRQGGTNILSALDTAYSVIKSQEIHPLTLVFLITDGESQTDGTPAADKLKADDYPLFTIGIGSTKLVHLEELSSADANGIKHFFHFQDYDLLKSIGEYLNPNKQSPGGPGNGTVC